MTYVISFLALAVAIAAGYVAWRLRAWATALEERAEEIDAQVAALATAPAAVDFPSERRIITVEVLNPIEVALAESKAAGVLATLRPALLTRVVYEQARKEIVAGLEEAGVAAEVRVHVVE